MSDTRECQHTRCPPGYTEWHRWAERKAKTHDQVECPVCGLWAVWKPKARPASPDNPKGSEPR